jgi:hypothetical protein
MEPKKEIDDNVILSPMNYYDEKDISNFVEEESDTNDYFNEVNEDTLYDEKNIDVVNNNDDVLNNNDNLISLINNNEATFLEENVNFDTDNIKNDNIEKDIVSEVEKIDDENKLNTSSKNDFLSSNFTTSISSPNG